MVLKIHDSLREWTRIDDSIRAHQAIIDSQSVKMQRWSVNVATMRARSQRAQTIYNSRYLGLVLRVLVTAANVEWNVKG